MPKNLTLALFALVLCLTCKLSAQTPSADPIDKTLDTCLAGPAGNNTVGQVDCSAKAAAAWDRELNQVYNKLLKSLDPASQTLLRASQRQWLAFREAEKKFQSGPWRSTQGTVVQVTLTMANVEILKSRVLTLRNYAGDGNPH